MPGNEGELPSRSAKTATTVIRPVEYMCRSPCSRKPLPPHANLCRETSTLNSILGDRRLQLLYIGFPHILYGGNYTGGMSKSLMAQSKPLQDTSINTNTRAAHMPDTPAARGFDIFSCSRRYLHGKDEEIYVAQSNP